MIHREWAIVKNGWWVYNSYKNKGECAAVYKWLKQFNPDIKIESQLSEFCIWYPYFQGAFKTGENNDS